MKELFPSPFLKPKTLISSELKVLPDDQSSTAQGQTEHPEKKNPDDFGSTPVQMETRAFDKVT